MPRVKLQLIACFLGLSQLAFGSPIDRQPPQDYLQFDGSDTNYVEVPDSEDFSVTTTGGLTVSAWMRPDSLTFPLSEGCGYVHWLGKGVRGEHEWVFRMYGEDDTCSPRRTTRISFYVFNPIGDRGCGSYFQDPVEAGKWVHVVGIIDAVGETTSIYKNGEWRNTNPYSDLIRPAHGTAPLRMGTRNLAGFFQGALAEVRIWNRVLMDAEIRDLYASGVVPRDGLVAEYLLNEGAGDTAYDTAGGHDGSVIGAAWGSGSFPLDSSETVQSGGGC